MLEKDLKLSQVMLAAYESAKDLGDETKRAAVNDYIGKLVVIEYLPLREKKAFLFRILNLLEENDKRPEEIVGQLEILFNLEMIQDYTNIYVEPEFYDLFGDEFLDTLEITGIKGAIEDINGRDVARLYNMLTATINWRDIFSVVDTFGQIDMAHVDELVNEVRAAKSGLTEENIDLLKRLANVNQPNAENLQDAITASIVGSLDKISEDELLKWQSKHDMIVNLDTLLGEKSYDHITKEIQDYFNNSPEYEPVDAQEIKNVYEYLKEKNQDSINKLDYQIAEENRVSIEKGMTAQMIKLLSKKKALEKRYKKEEELLKLADVVMSMDNTSIDEVSTILNQYKTDNTQKEENTPQ